MDGVRSSLGLYTRQNVRQLRWPSRSPHSRQIQPLLTRGIDGRGRAAVLYEQPVPADQAAHVSDLCQDLAAYDQRFDLPPLRCRWSPTSPAQPTRRWLTWRKCWTPKWCTRSPPAHIRVLLVDDGDVPGTVRYDPQRLITPEIRAYGRSGPASGCTDSP